jgi:type IV pilus assembly protein PilA
MLALALLRIAGMAARNTHGFTLLELLVVTSIIGILASIAIPQYASYRARGFDSIVEAQVRHVATGQEAYFVDNGQYAPDVTSLEHMAIEDGISITIAAGNTGSLQTSFRIHGSHSQAAHSYDWVSDPVPGEANFSLND